MRSRKGKSKTQDFINISNYDKAVYGWANIDLHCRYLLSFLAIHEAARYKPVYDQSEIKKKANQKNYNTYLSNCSEGLKRSKSLKYL